MKAAKLNRCIIGNVKWEKIRSSVYSTPRLRYIYVADDSVNPYEDDEPPYRKIAYVNTALSKIDLDLLDKINEEEGYFTPPRLGEYYSTQEIYSTIFPLRNASFVGMNSYDTMR